MVKIVQNIKTLENNKENRDIKDRPRPQNFSLSERIIEEWEFEANLLGLSRNEFFKLLFLFYKKNKKNKFFIEELKTKYLKDAVKK